MTELEWLTLTDPLAMLEALGARASERSEEHTSELQSRENLVCRLLLECCGAHRDLHSFPTRRSSDLGKDVQISCPPAGRLTRRATPASASLCGRRHLTGGRWHDGTGVADAHRPARHAGGPRGAGQREIGRAHV